MPPSMEAVTVARAEILVETETEVAASRLAQLSHELRGSEILRIAGEVRQYAAAGNPERAHSALQRLQSPAGRQHISQLSVAQIYTTLGNRDRALDCLEQACRNREWSLSALKQDPRLDPLRSSPRYRKVLAQVGL